MGAPLSRVVAARAESTFPPTVIAELASIEAALGGRTQVVALLLFAPLTPDLKYVLGLLGDPKYGKDSLAELCAIANVLPAELLKLLSGAALLRGKVLASQKIGDGIAAVAEDVMKRAAPYEGACSTCRGIGSVTPDPTPETPNPIPGPCETCNGSGKLVYQPTLDRQKLAIEMAQLLPKSGGIQIGVQQVNQAQQSGGRGTLERLQQLTDKLLYAQPSGARPLPEDEADPPVDAA